MASAAQQRIDAIEKFDKEVVEFYLSNPNDDDIEQKTCEKFGISSDSLNLILMASLFESGLG